jgi:hypothetical protein
LIRNYLFGTDLSKTSRFDVDLDKKSVQNCFKVAILGSSVGDPDPEPDPHVLGLPDPSVRGMDPIPAPDSSLFSNEFSGLK